MVAKSANSTLISVCQSSAWFLRRTELAAAAAAERARAAHSQLVAAATVDDGPLSIGGWVPPNVPMPAAAVSPPGVGAGSAALDAGDAEEADGAPPAEPAAVAQPDTDGGVAAASDDAASSQSDDDSSNDSDTGGDAADGDRPLSFF